MVDFLNSSGITERGQDVLQVHCDGGGHANNLTRGTSTFVGSGEELVHVSEEGGPARPCRWVLEVSGVHHFREGKGGVGFLLCAPEVAKAYCSSVSTRPCLAGDVDWIAAIFGLRTALHLCAMNVTLYMENSAVLDLVREYPPLLAAGIERNPPELERELFLLAGCFESLDVSRIPGVRFCRLKQSSVMSKCDFKMYFTIMVSTGPADHSEGTSCVWSLLTKCTPIRLRVK